jgi:hypothetical protein
MRTLIVQDDKAEDDGVARTREQPRWMPSEAIVFIGTVSLALTAIIGLGIGVMLRRISVARAVARADVAAGVPFELRFQGASRKHRVLLAFEVEHPGDEDDEGLTARLDVHAAGHGPVSIEHRIGNHAPAIAQNFTQNTARYAVLITSEGARSTTTATVPIASIGRAEGDVIILGRLLLAEGQTARRLFVYVVPG